MAGAVLLLGTSCSEDRDSNPTFKEAPTFVLNTPAYAANNVYDLKNSDFVTLTTSQPDYGFPVSTVYTAHVSLDNENFTPMATTSTSAMFQIPAAELNELILSLAGDADLTQPIPVFIKLTAHVFGNPELGVSESNVIELPKVLAYVPEVVVELPQNMYIVGDFAASAGWTKFVPLHGAYSQDGWFYGVVYMQAGAEFKVNPDAGWKGNDKGYGQVTPVDNAEAGLESTDASNDAANMRITNAGWYNVMVKTKIANGAVIYTVEIQKAKVYIVGAAEGGNWSLMDEWKFTAPENATGEWVSPVLAGSGELRMAIDCGTDWWKTEFTIKSDGTLYFRDVDIPNNWAENVGADFSQQVSQGQTVYLNFTEGTGRVE